MDVWTNNDDILLPLELQNVNDFGFIDFLDETNFDQFIRLVRGHQETEEEPPLQFFADFDFAHVDNMGCLAESQFVPTPDDLYDFNISSFSEFNTFPGDLNIEEDDVENDGKEQSSAVTTPTERTKRADRSRTLISERKRRGRMKEKLYALRSIVPNITKMDKASIIGDAIRYVQDLQMKADKLKAEVANLELSLNQPHHQSHPRRAALQDSCLISQITPTPPPIKKILQMEVFQVELREFYVRIVCNKRQGIAALLYKALDSLALTVRSSNLATTADENYLFTFNVNINEFEMHINLPNLKLWIISTFCNQGFDFVRVPSS